MNEEEVLNEIEQLDIENEEMAVGFMLQDEQAAIMASKLLQEKHFITAYAAFVLKVVKSCLLKGDSVSDAMFQVTSITKEDWKNLNKSSDITCQEYTTSCLKRSLSFVGNSIFAEGIFKKIQDQYLRREGLTLLNESKNKLLKTTDSKNSKEVMFEVGQKANDAINNLIVEESISYKELALSVLHQKEEKALNTGYLRLDEIIGGFRKGELITIGAATGVGKSAFAINLLLNITEQENVVGLWSFEMSESEILQRIFSNRSGLGKKTDRYEERVNRVRKYLDESNDNVHLFTNQIKDLSIFYLQCRKLSLKKNMKVVIIDYLQLIRLSDFKGFNRTPEIERITNTLKSMASELGITIIILSQLSREHLKREDKTPRLSDLRDSGSIEQDSNIVILLHKFADKPFDYKDWEECVELIVAKNRSGRCGSFKMRYNGSLTRFTEEGLSIEKDSKVIYSSQK